MKFNSIKEAVDDIRNGKVVVVVDDENRENEGDFVAAAEKATSKMINFMATHGRGLICAPLIEKTRHLPSSRLNHTDPLASMNPRHPTGEQGGSLVSKSFLQSLEKISEKFLPLINCFRGPEVNSPSTRTNRPSRCFSFTSFFIFLPKS